MYFFKLHDNAFYFEIPKSYYTPDNHANAKNLDSPAGDGQKTGREGKQSPKPAGTPFTPSGIDLQTCPKCTSAKRESSSVDLSLFLPRRSSPRFRMNPLLDPKKQTRKGLSQRLPGKLCPKSGIGDSNPCDQLTRTDHPNFIAKKPLLSLSHRLPQSGLTHLP